MHNFCLGEIIGIMWQAETDTLKSSKVIRYRIRCNAARLSYAEVINNWQYDEAFRNFFMTLLAESEFSAYFWETVPVSNTSIDQCFEFVLVDSPQMAVISADSSAFAGNFEKADVVSFLNLSGDARLIVPCPAAPNEVYTSIATFARLAPAAQQHALWKRVGLAMEHAVQNETVWLNTSGLGVSWLHVRLDQRPKYYSHAPYRDMKCVQRSL